jgi:hypothetical protein
MPEINRFYGIIILMFFGDPNPAHFHVEYGGRRSADQHQHAGRDPREIASSYHGDGGRMGLIA